MDKGEGQFAGMDLNEDTSATDEKKGTERNKPPKIPKITEDKQAPAKMSKEKQQELTKRIVQ